MTALIWLRNDLRLNDNPAIHAAIKTSLPVIFYFHDETEKHEWLLGSASKFWLFHSLKAFEEELKKLGGHLLLGSGNLQISFANLLKTYDITHVFFNERIEPHERKCDYDIVRFLKKEKIKVQTSFGNLLYDPKEINTPSGGVYKIYTPFWNALEKLGEPKAPCPKPTSIHFAKVSNKIKLNDLSLESFSPWQKNLLNYWEIGSVAARKTLKEFINQKLDTYTHERDFPSINGTSLLSPHLHFGEISPKEIWHAIKNSDISDAKSNQYLKEIGWREFAQYTLYHFPSCPLEPLREEFAHFPWVSDKALLHAWQQGQTGYPIVDAGMRQLLETGWMHNRVRMIVASFLVKDLLLPWQEGAKWFWQHLVDADLGNNTLGWQWSAGCGVDAAPYFRVFNPITQSEKFDPEGLYCKKYLPELKNVPKKFIHAPWKANGLQLKEWGVVLGKNYPHPICDHDEARKYALAAFEKITKHKK